MLSVNEIYQARKFLNESQWKGFESEGGSNETDINFSRYISGVPETQIDGLLEFIRRYVSVKNAFFDVVATRAAGGAGSYRWTEEVVNGFPVFRMVGGTFSFQVVDVAGDLRWALYDGLSVVEQSTSDAMGGDPSVSVIGATWPVLSGELGVTDEEISARSVVDPQVNNGKIRQGLWRNGSVRQMKDLDGRFGDKGGWVLVQELMLELNVVAPIAVDDTRWRIKNLEAFRSGSRNIVLELPYCDPTDLQAMVDENTNAVYDSEIYTINGGVLEGKWYRQDIQSVVDPQTGYGTLLWMLRSHTNDDMGFVYMAAKCERHLQFYKSHLAADGIQDFRDQYYFDISGSFYVSADGVNYTAKDGQPATGTLPSTAKNLDEYDEARAIVDYSVVPNERTGEVDVRVHIVWKVCFVSDGVRTFVSADEIETRILLSDVTESEKDDFFDHTYYDAEGHWYYSADGTSYTRKDGETASGTLPASATLLNVWMEGRKIRVQESFSDVSKRWSVLVVALFGQIDSRTAISNAPAFYPSKDVKVTLSKGFNYSYSELMALSSAVVPAGTERQFEYERLENGRYNWVDVLSVRTGFQVSFELGDRKYDIGNHMVKPPTTDTGASPSEYTIVAVDGVSNEQVDYNDEDGTWSWIIVSVSGRDDVGFVYMANRRERHLQFYKMNLESDKIQDFRDQYYFDSDGSFYVSADGVNYTAKDGQPATGTLPSTAKNLDEDADGRTIPVYTANPDDRTGLQDVHVHFIWRVGNAEEGVRTESEYGTITTQLSLEDVTESVKDGFFANTYFDESGHWYYSTDGTNYTRKDGETASGALPADAKLLDELQEGRTVRVQQSLDATSDFWNVDILAQFGDADSRTDNWSDGNATPTFYPSKDVKVTIDKGFNYTHDHLIALNTAGSSAGYKIQFEYDRLPNGRYNWVKVVSYRTGFQMSFELGDKVYHIGDHMAKPPNTDSTASSATYTIISVDGVADELVDYNDEDGTWSWKIVSEKDKDEPSGSATFIVEFGEADQWVQLVSEVSSTSLPNGGVPDLGEFKNVTITDLAGTSKTLTGRAKTVTRYDNFSVKDKKYSYRKLRLGYNAPLAPTTTVAITAVEKVYFSDKMDAVLVEYTTPTHALAVGDELFFIDSLVYPYEPTPAKILAKSGTTYRLERPFVKDDPSATGHVPYMKLDDSSIHYYDVTSFALAEDTSKVKLVGDFLHSPVMPGEKIKVTGTSDYDGTHTVLESAPSYVVIAETFTSTKTGTGTLQEDGWFFVAGGYSIDREKRTYKLDGDFDDDDNPKVTEIATRAWRKIFTQQVQKLFVRRPTPADLVAAGIEPAEAPKNELGPTVKDGVVQLSQHLFSYERVITTASKRESEVVDVPMVSIVQSYKTPE